LPFLPNSLLNNHSYNFRDIDTFISHLDIGMCFNYKPWSYTNYFTYFIDYIHEGDSRLWYIIPPSEISKVEKLIKEQKIKNSNNDTNSQLFISPKIFLEHDIKLQSIIQEKGEFLVIYPQSYYCYFDFGVNIYIYIFL